jgi:hypothetical protein
MVLGRDGWDATEETRRTVTLHDGEELDDDLGGRADQDLALDLVSSGHC